MVVICFKHANQHLDISNSIIVLCPEKQSYCLFLYWNSWSTLRSMSDTSLSVVVDPASFSPLTWKSVHRDHPLSTDQYVSNWPLARYVKLGVTHAPGMSGTFSPPLPVSDPDMHHGTCVTHVPWCIPGSLTSGLLWSRWMGKRSRHSRRMRNSQFYVSGKRPILKVDTENIQSNVPLTVLCLSILCDSYFDIILPQLYFVIW